MTIADFILESWNYQVEKKRSCAMSITLISLSLKMSADLKVYGFVEKVNQQPTKTYPTSFKKGGLVASYESVCLIKT